MLITTFNHLLENSHRISQVQKESNPSKPQWKIILNELLHQI